MGCLCPRGGTRSSRSCGGCWSGLRALRRGRRAAGRPRPVRGAAGGRGGGGGGTGGGGGSPGGGRGSARPFFGFGDAGPGPRRLRGRIVEWSASACARTCIAQSLFGFGACCAGSTTSDRGRGEASAEPRVGRRAAMERRLDPVGHPRHTGRKTRKASRAWA